MTSRIHHRAAGLGAVSAFSDGINGGLRRRFAHVAWPWAAWPCPDRVGRSHPAFVAGDLHAFREITSRGAGRVVGYRMGGQR